MYMQQIMQDSKVPMYDKWIQTCENMPPEDNYNEMSMSDDDSNDNE